MNNDKHSLVSRNIGNAKVHIAKDDSILQIMNEVERIVGEDKATKVKQTVPQPRLNSEADNSQNPVVQNDVISIGGRGKGIPSLTGFSQQQVIVSAKQLLLRGAFLRNTEYVIGVVVYTGLDSKIMRNSGKSNQKSSEMEKTMNRYILGILILQLVTSFITALLGFFWNSHNLDSHAYLRDENLTKKYGAQAILNFFTYFLLYNTMIPISLIVSLEMVKVAQG